MARPFPHHRPAGLALLNGFPGLSHKAAGFLGHGCVVPVLTDRQRDWLVQLLDQHGQPPLAEGGAS